MRHNRTKARLKANQPTFCLWTRTVDVGLMEFMGYQGWDCFVFDGEHGVIDAAQAEHLIRAAELRDVTPLVRVSNKQPDTILRYLDVGAQGIVAPRVDNGPQAAAVVKAIKYPPLGMRGLAGVRAATFGHETNLAAHVEQSNLETLTIVQIESAEAVQNIDAILATAHVDVVFIGPADLSLSLGVPGDTGNPAVKEAINHVFQHARAADVAVGTLFKDAAGARVGVETGYLFIAITLEAFTGVAARRFLSMRADIEGPSTVY